MQVERAARRWIGQPPGDWELVSSARLNLWLVGCREATSLAIRALVPALQAPVYSMGAGEGLTLPRVDHSGWLVLTDISELSLRGQDRLIGWLNENEDRAHVISVSRQPMTEMIANGQFLPTLYYRLNIVYIDLTEMVITGSRP